MWSPRVNFKGDRRADKDEVRGKGCSRRLTGSSLLFDSIPLTMKVNMNEVVPFYGAVGEWVLCPILLVLVEWSLRCHCPALRDVVSNSEAFTSQESRFFSFFGDETIKI